MTFVQHVPCDTAELLNCITKQLALDVMTAKKKNRKWFGRKKSICEYRFIILTDGERLPVQYGNTKPPIESSLKLDTIGRMDEKLVRKGLRSISTKAYSIDPTRITYAEGDLLMGIYKPHYTYVIEVHDC